MSDEIMNRVVALYYKLKCYLDFHTEVMIDEAEDPYLGCGVPGHLATSYCSRCDKHRRYLGHDGKVKFIMPWVRFPKEMRNE